MTPGDVILVPGTGWIERLIEWASGGPFSHAALVGDGHLIEAAFGGVHRAPLLKYAGVGSVLVPSGATAANRRVAVAWAEARVGQPYGWRDVALDAGRDLLHLPLGWRVRHPGHLDCLPTGTTARALGRVDGAGSRDYIGDVAVVTLANGYELAVTPNHPIATATGWVAASLLQPSDNVVCCPWPEVELPDHNNVPTAIEQIAEALPFSWTQMVLPEDFHGDGVGGEVCVVRSDRLLGHRLDTAFADQALEQDFLGCLAGSAFPAERACGATLGPVVAAFAGRPGRLRDQASVPTAGMGEAQSSGFGSAPKRHALLTQDPEHGAAGDAMQMADLRRRQATEVLTPDGGDVLRDPLVGWHPAAPQGGTSAWPQLRRQQLAGLGGAPQNGPLLPEEAEDRCPASPEISRQLARRLAVSVSLSHPVRVRRQPFVGRVHSLQTSTGAFIAEGILTKNCSCLVTAAWWQADVALTYVPVPSPSDLGYSPGLVGPRAWVP